MYLDYDHLHLYVKNYNRYKNAIKRLELEIEELETMINPKGIDYSKPVSSGTPSDNFKIQCFHEINQKQDDIEPYLKMVKTVDELLTWFENKGNRNACYIILERMRGVTLEQIADDLSYSLQAIDKIYRKNLNHYLFEKSRNSTT